MTTTAPDLDRLRQRLQDEPVIVAAWLFGSRARGTARPDSDVDVAYLADVAATDALRYRLALTERLRDALGLPDGGIDVLDVTDADPLVAHEAMQGRVLVDRDPSRRIEVQLAGLHRAEEARHLRRIWREVREAEARRGRT